MTIRIVRRKYLFAYPTKVLFTLTACHLITSCYFLRRSSTMRTWPKLHAFTLSKSIEIKFFLTFMSFIPPLSAIETQTGFTRSTNNSVFTTTTWLIQNSFTIRHWAILLVLVHCNLILLIGLLKL